MVRKTENCIFNALRALRKSVTLANFSVLSPSWTSRTAQLAPQRHAMVGRETREEIVMIMLLHAMCHLPVCMLVGANVREFGVCKPPFPHTYMPETRIPSPFVPNRSASEMVIL